MFNDGETNQGSFLLRKLKGVRGDTCDLSKGLVKVSYSSPATPKAILAALDNLGYQAKTVN